MSQGPTTSTPIQEYVASPSELSIALGDLEDNTYGQAVLFQTQFSGQGFSDYPDTLAGEVSAVLASDRIAGSPPLHSYQSRHVR